MKEQIEKLIEKYESNITDIDINDLVYEMLDDYDRGTVETLKEVISDLTNLLKQNQ